MAVIFIEGFDKYGPAGINGDFGQNTPTDLDPLLLSGEWTSIQIASGPALTLVAGLAGAGQALQVVSLSATAIAKTLAASFSRLIGGFRFKPTTFAGIAGITFTASGTAQYSVTVNATGAISLRTGLVSGTIVATSVTTVTVGSVHYLEWDVSSGTGAAYQIWLDGVSVLSSTANTGSNVNGFEFGFTSNTTFVIDDLYLFDSTGTVNNAALLTNPVIETNFPTSDVQTVFSNGASVLGQEYGATASTNAPGANELFLRSFTPSSNQTINSISCFPRATSAAAKYKAVIYADSGGSPNGQSLIATGAEVVGTTTGVTLTSAFASPASLINGTAYWLGFITDTSVVLAEVDATTTGVKAANTYANGAPATSPTVTTAQPSWIIWGNCTGSPVNWLSQNQSPPHSGDTSFVTSSNPGDEDLYGFDRLLGTPATIHTVAVKAYARKTTNGARTMDLRTKSGISADSGGSATGQSPTTAYTHSVSYFDTDPNTNSAWIASGLNAASSGVKVAS